MYEYNDRRSEPTRLLGEYVPADFGGSYSLLVHRMGTLCVMQTSNHRLTTFTRRTHRVTKDWPARHTHALKNEN